MVHLGHQQETSLGLSGLIHSLQSSLQGGDLRGGELWGEQQFGVILAPDPGVGVSWARASSLFSLYSICF